MRKQDSALLIIHSAKNVNVQSAVFTCFIGGSLRAPEDKLLLCTQSYIQSIIQFTSQPVLLLHLCGTISFPQHTATLFLYPEPQKTSEYVSAFCLHISLST